MGHVTTHAVSHVKSHVSTHVIGYSAGSATANPIALVNSRQDLGQASDTTLVSGAWTNTSGNLLVAMVSWRTTDVTPTIADTAGNTWAEAGTHTWGATLQAGVAIFYAKNCVAASGNIVTVTFSGSVNVRVLMLAQFSGADLAAPFDVVGSIGEQTAGAGNDNMSSGAVTAGQSNSVYIGAGFETGGNSTISSGTGFTKIQDSVTPFAGFASYNMEYFVQGATAPQAALWTIPNGEQYIGRVAVLKPAA